MKNWSNLAQVVYKRTYARKFCSGVESWINTVERAIAGNVRNHNVSEQEIQRLRYFMTNRKSMPAGRGLWFSGSPGHAKLGGAALCNCWGLTCDDWMNFVLGQDLLMLGGGVGMSVEQKYVHLLPKIKKDVKIIHRPTKDADFIVPDSREGWNELTRRTLESLFVTGKSFSYSCVCVRGRDEPINGFGGKASGPGPLIALIEKIVGIAHTREGKKLRSIDCADVMAAIAEMVVSGNVRRSATLMLGDPWDKEYLKAKRWDLGVLPTQRAMANYSVAVDDVDDLHPLFWKTYEIGESFGVVNRTNMAKWGRMGEENRNPCVITNPCVPAGTSILTKDGEVAIETRVGQETEIWNGFEWSVVIPKITGFYQKMLKVTLSSGQSLTCTLAHKWIAYQYDDGVDEWVTKVEAQDLLVKDRLFSYKLPSGEVVSGLTVANIEDAGIADVVYCFTEPKRHLGCFNGIVTGQCGEASLEDGEACNLLEQALPHFSSVDELEESSRLMFRYGRRVTDEKFHIAKCDEVIKRNRKVGIGITGCLQSPQFFNPEVLDRMYNAIQDENRKYSQEHNQPLSIRTTCLKPSGTLSKLMDVAGEGIHGVISRYIIQRIRFSSTDPLVLKLRAAGHHIEQTIRFDGTLDPNTLVVDFYAAAPPELPCVDGGFGTWQQLDQVIMAQKYWADQSISVTVYYKKEEIEKVKEWLANNLKNIKTVSFLCYQEHGFKQAPKEAITKEQYERLSAKIKPIEVDDDQSTGDTIEGIECGSGGCPIR